ncbi:MAG: hypothetical protein IAG10_13235, partial [Planctomycetaceae bacterium]|nr:hypothetical protein [Planctomycetaceae bacterium]
FVNLTGSINASITDTQGIGTIIDDDATPSVSINDVTVTEGNAGPGSVAATFTVTLSAASGQTVTVNAATANNTAVAPGDYTAVSIPVTFAPGVTTQTVTVLVNGDTLDEPTETFFVNLSLSSDPTSNATIADSQGIGTILDDDAATATVTLVISDPILSEAGETTTVTAILSALSGQDVTVNLAFSGTATNNGDYTRSGAQIVIPAGSFSGSITLTAVADVLDEPDETIVVDIDNVTNATELGTQQVTATIVDDDPTPTLSVSNAAAVTEGDSSTTSAVFTVTLAGPSAQTVTVTATTSDGTATASSGDYTAASTTLTFAPGETTKTVSVLVNGDTRFEPDETFFLNLSNPSNATVTDGQGQGTILDDEVDPTTIPGFVGLVDDPLNPGQQYLLVVGTIADDKIRFIPKLYGQQILVQLNRVTVGLFDHDKVSRIVALGLEGNDRIHVELRNGKPAELRGNDGNDTLIGGRGNDELFGGDGNDVLHGRIGLDRLYGEDGNDTLEGQEGHDILLGGSGNDKLNGGKDRDILIGGEGTDTLKGDSGDDILIGGSTAHDDDQMALVAILSELTSGNTYADRVANIRDGSGDVSGQNDGNFFDDGTVIDDGEVDQLFGGSNQDWFVNFEDNDVLKDRKTSSNPAKNELVN